MNAIRHIIEDTSGKHSTLKIARRKLDAIGNIKSHSGIFNNPECLTKLENRLKLADSISFIKDKDQQNKIKKNNKEYTEHIDIATKSFKKLFDSESKKLKKKELRTILLCSYNVDLKESQNNKQAYLDRLESERKSNPEMIDRLKDHNIDYFWTHMAEYLTANNNSYGVTEDATSDNESNNDDQESTTQIELV